MNNEKFDWWLDQIASNPSVFREGKFGLEKENLRIMNDGTLDHSDHPIKEEDPYFQQVVRDFSESQIEFITKPLSTPLKALEELRTIQDHVLENYDMRLWPFSMPCRIEDPSKIRIAEFPDTEAGRAARGYRELLAVKHGKKMQLISGVHYNFSFGDSFLSLFAENEPTQLSLKDKKSHLYFHVARNLLRHQWFLTYLFGASPSVDVTYRREVLERLQKIECFCDCPYENHTYYEAHGVSLRMSRYGYHSDMQRQMKVSYNCLEDYIHYIREGIHSGILQKESEYYSPVRFKHSAGKPGEMLKTLETEGVEYIELRLFDLNPYDPYNVTEMQVYFTHLFMVYAAMIDSPLIDQAAMDRIYVNDQYVALFGRDPKTEIVCSDQKGTIKEFGGQLMSKLYRLAELLDQGMEKQPYTDSVALAEDRIDNPMNLLSEQLTQSLLLEGISYVRQGINLSHASERK